MHLKIFSTKQKPFCSAGFIKIFKTHRSSKLHTLVSINSSASLVRIWFRIRLRITGQTVWLSDPTAVIAAQSEAMASGPLAFHEHYIMYMYIQDKGMDYNGKSMVKSMLTDKDFLTSLLTGWQLCSQTIRSQAWKFLLPNMNFNLDISPIIPPPGRLQWVNLSVDLWWTLTAHNFWSNIQVKLGYVNTVNLKPGAWCIANVSASSHHGDLYLGLTKSMV